MMKRLKVRIRASRIRANRLLKWNKHIKELERQCSVKNKMFDISIGEPAKYDQDKRLSEIYRSLFTQTSLLTSIFTILQFFQIMYIVIMTAVSIILLIAVFLK